KMMAMLRSWLHLTLMCAILGLHVPVCCPVIAFDQAKNHVGCPCCAGEQEDSEAPAPAAPSSPKTPPCCPCLVCSPGYVPCQTGDVALSIIDEHTSEYLPLVTQTSPCAGHRLAIIRPPRCLV